MPALLSTNQSPHHYRRLPFANKEEKEDSGITCFYSEFSTHVQMQSVMIRLRQENVEIDCNGGKGKVK